MRKLMVSQMQTLDGFFAGPNGEIDWHVVDNEFNDFAIDQLDHIDTLIFGRITYQLMADYWPTPAAVGDDPEVAKRMNSLTKLVFSRTLSLVPWSNSHLVKEDLLEAVARLKEEPGKDIVIFGSGTIVAQLAQAGLIDEYRIIINPVILGSDRTMFEGIHDRLPLKLIKARPMHSGNVILYYEPDRPQR